MSRWLLYYAYLLVVDVRHTCSHRPVTTLRQRRNFEAVYLAVTSQTQLQHRDVHRLVVSLRLDKTQIIFPPYSVPPKYR